MICRSSNWESEWGRKVNVAWLLVPDGLIWVTAKVLRFVSLNAQHAKHWSRCVTREEDHTEWHSCQLKTGNWSSHLGRNGCPLNRHTGVFIAELEVSDPTFTVSVFCKHRLQIDEPQSQWDVQCNYSKCDCCSSLVCTIQKKTFLLQTALHLCNESNNTNMVVHKWTQHTYVPSPRISGSNVLLHAGVCTELSEGIITF